jgi:gliding motility-associated-like protein
MNSNRTYLFQLVFFLFVSLPAYSQFVPEKIKGGLFIENKGQWEQNVLYRSEIPSGQLYIEKNRFLFNFYDQEAAADHSHGRSHTSQNTSGLRVGGGQGGSKQPVSAHAYEVAFIGCSPISSTQGVNPSNHAYNYFKGNDQSKWASNAKAYDQTIMNNIYPNTSLVCFGKETGFKYEFHLDVGANPDVIKMKYDGVDHMYLKNGELFIETSITDFYEQKPFAYQEINDKRIEVPCQFKLTGHVLSFIFPKGYNKKFPLVIDPQLIFSTYSGSTADNWGNSATYDDDGNTYMVGIAFDYGYPVTLGAYQTFYRGYPYIDSDVAIMKFDPVGKVLYATYLGGGNTEVPSSCIVNSKKELIVFGFTSSHGNGITGFRNAVFPTTPGAYDQAFNGGFTIEPMGAYDRIYFYGGSDLFISTLSADGSSLQHSTLIGGSGNDGMTELGDPLSRNYGDQFRGEIYSDEADNVYIVTKTFSPDIINTSVPGYDKTFNGPVGTLDAYVCKLSGDLSTMLWDTFIGGADDDAGYSIRVAADKSVYITGGTTSADFPVSASVLRTSYGGEIDGYISHLSSDGTSLLHSTYIGTPSYDQCFFIQLDALENIYILGQSLGDFPMSPGVYGQASTGQFIQKINPALSSVLLSTTFGSSVDSINIVPTAFLVNSCDNILIAGWGGNVNHTDPDYYPKNMYIGGNTFGMQPSPDALYPNTDGSDFYLLVLEKQFNSLLYATFFGGFGEDDHVDGGTSRFDKNGIVYQSVCASCRTRPVSTSNFPVTDGSKKRNINCNNACFKYDLSSLRADFIMDPLIGCGPTTVTLTNTSTGGVAFEWDLGDGTKVNGPGPVTHTYPTPGTYHIKLIATDLTTCIGKDTATKTLNVFAIPGIGITLSDTTICPGDTISILKNCNPYYTYNWAPAIEMINPAVCDAQFFPSITRDYYLTVIDTSTCVYTDTLTIHVPTLIPGINWENMTHCDGKPTIGFSNPSKGRLKYLWDLGDGTTTTVQSPVHEYAKGGKYIIKVKVYANDTCFIESTIPLVLDDIQIPNLFTPNDDGKNDCFEIKGLYPNWKVEVYNPWSKSIFKTDSYNNEFCGEGLSSSVYYYLVCPPYGKCCKSWVQIIIDK